MTWLGQAGFRIELDGQRVVIDPWQSPHEGRLIPAAPLDLVADDVDWVLITHEHLDHLDLPFLPVVLDRSPGARVVVPEPLAPMLDGVVPTGRLVLVQPHDTLDLDGLEVSVVPAFHGVSMADAYGDGSAVGGRPRFVGYVLGAATRLYHAGDTVPDERLSEALRDLAVDTALLPVNGRDADRESRGIVGNLDAAEAVELALEIGATRLVPYHWDGFAGNTVPPETVGEAAAGRIEVTVPTRFTPLEP